MTEQPVPRNPCALPFATYNAPGLYERFRTKLEKDFKLSKSADNNVYLGCVIERLADHAIQIHQRPYIDDLLNKFRMADCKPAKSPYQSGVKLSKTQSPTTAEEKAEMSKCPYRQIVGSLLHLAKVARPDIAHAVSSCARYCNNPGKAHWNALKYILRYLKGTRNLALVYGRAYPGIPFAPLHGYCDGSWGDDPDDRRSCSGYNFWAWGGPISWRSKRQQSVALSSCQSEYMAASDAAREAVWLRRMYEMDLGYSDLTVETRGDLSEREYHGGKPLTIFEDNQGCIYLSRNPVSHKNNKHIEIRYHYVREQVAAGTLKLVKIDTKENVADIHTKATATSTFVHLRDKILHPREKPVHASMDKP